MSKRPFFRGEIYIPEKEESRTISFVTSVYQDKNDKEKIWVVSKDILAPTEINNHEQSVNYHPKAFARLKEILKNEGKWTEQ